MSLMISALANAQSRVSNLLDENARLRLDAEHNITVLSNRVRELTAELEALKPTSSAIERVNSSTDRMRVPGGWLYSTNWGSSGALCFVPDTAVTTATEVLK